MHMYVCTHAFMVCMYVCMYLPSCPALVFPVVERIMVAEVGMTLVAVTVRLVPPTTRLMRRVRVLKNVST